MSQFTQEMTPERNIWNVLKNSLLKIQTFYNGIFTYTTSVIRKVFLKISISGLALAILSGNYSLAEESSTPLRGVISLNGTWKTKASSIKSQKEKACLQNGFEDAAKEEGTANKWESPEYNDGNWENVALPHNRKKDNIDIRWYRKKFNLPKDSKNKRVILQFDKITYVSWLWINGKQIFGKYEVDKKYGKAAYQGIFTGCEYDITDYVSFDSPNLIAVKLFWPKELTLPFVPQNGILRDVRLLLVPDAYLSRTLITPDIDNSSVNVSVLVRNTLPVPFAGNINYRLSRVKSKDGVQTGPGAKINIPANSEKEINFEIKYNKPLILWTPNNPQLYNLTLSLSNDDLKDSVDNRFGFRKFEAKNRTLYLNNKSFFIKGAPSFSNPDNLYLSKEKDFNINIVRTQLFPASEKFHNKADEQGILVIAEFSGYAGKKWIEYGLFDEFNSVYLRELPRAVYSLYNHPCIVIWSLGNEVWNLPVSMHNKRYESAKKIDSSRPIITSTGGPEYMFGGLKLAEFEGYKTDIYDIHCYYGWYNRPILYMEDWIDFYAKMKPGKPLTSTETLGRYFVDKRNYIWKRWLGHRYMDFFLEKDLKSAYALTRQKCADGMKTVVEMWRMRKGDTAGAMIYTNLHGETNEIHNMLRHVFSPKFTCARFYKRNYFTGDKPEFPLYVINDEQTKIKNAKVGLEVSDGKDVPLLKKEYDFGRIDGNGIKKLPASFKIGDWPQGHYKLNLVLRNGSETICKNDYKFFVMSNSLKDKNIKTAKRILLLDNKGKTEHILSNLAVEFVRKTSLADVDLNEFDTLIVGADFSGDIYSKLVAGWVKKGGRVLCLEQDAEKTEQVVRSLCPFLNFTYNYKGQDAHLGEYSHFPEQLNSFVDITKSGHPVFKGINPLQFEDWNHYRHVLAEGFFNSSRGENSTIEKSSLAEVGGVPGGKPVGSVVFCFAYGKGEYLINQIQAIKRYGDDPVATKYVQNLFEYILTGGVVAEKYTDQTDGGIGPFEVGKNGFIRHWLICGPFPNPGGRPQGNKNNQVGFDKEFLKFRSIDVWEFMCKNEEFDKNAKPAAGIKHTVVFPKTKEGYWNLKKDKIVECAWKRTESFSDFINLSRFSFSNNIVAYGACYIDSPENREVKLKIGSDDGYKIYLNQQLIAKLNTTREAIRDQEEYKLKLNKGLNTLLIKVIQDIGDFGFFLRFTDLHDKPINKLKIWLKPKK